VVGQSKKDRTWPLPRGRQGQPVTQHVWVNQPGTPPVPPVQGLVVDWRRHSYRWSALCVFTVADLEGRPVVVQQWLSAEDLTPVFSDPNASRARRLL